MKTLALLFVVLCGGCADGVSMFQMEACGRTCGGKGVLRVTYTECVCQGSAPDAGPAAHGEGKP